MLNGDGRSKRDGFKQLPNVVVVQGDAAPCPISLRAAAVNEYFAPQGSILRRSRFPVDGGHDLVALESRDQMVPQSPLGAGDVRVAQLQGETEPAPGILEADVEVPFRSTHVAGFYLVVNRFEPECNPVCPDELTARIKAQLPFALHHEDTGLDEREL